MAVTLSILHSYYPIVSSLRQYLTDHVYFSDGSPLLQSDDAPTFTALVHRSHVAPDVHVARERKFKAGTPMVHLHEVSQDYILP